MANSHSKMFSDYNLKIGGQRSSLIKFEGCSVSRKAVTKALFTARRIISKRQHASNVLEKFGNTPITSHFGSVFAKNLGRENHVIVVLSLFSKSYFFQKFFRSVFTKT